MNAPLFDMSNLKAPYGTVTWNKEFWQETRRCCEPIEARIVKVLTEKTAILTEAIGIEKQLETERGFFTRLKLKLKLNRLEKQVEWRNKVISELYTALLRRTITW